MGFPRSSCPGSPRVKLSIGPEKIGPGENSLENIHLIHNVSSNVK